MTKFRWRPFLFLENTLILGRKLKIRRLNLSEDLFLFLKITMILGQNWFFVWESQTIFLSYPKCISIKSWFGQTSQNLGKTSLPPQIFLGWYGYGCIYTTMKVRLKFYYLFRIWSSVESVWIWWFELYIYKKKRAFTYEGKQLAFLNNR